MRGTKGRGTGTRAVKESSCRLSFIWLLKNNHIKAVRAYGKSMASTDNDTVREYLRQLVRKQRANGACEITLPDLIKKWEEQEGKCFLSGIELRVDETGDWRPSIGRKNPTLGFTHDNVALCCLEFNGPCPWSSGDIKGDVTFDAAPKKKRRT